MRVFAAGATGAIGTQLVPRFVVRLLAGEGPVMTMTEVRGASNAKAKRELDWRPRWSSWPVGFVKGLDQ